jgi:hypothetical protein
LALHLGFRFRLGLSPLPRGGNRGQALLPSRQLSGELVASTAPQHRVVRFVLLIRRRDQGLFAAARTAMTWRISVAEQLFPHCLLVTLPPWYTCQPSLSWGA